MNNFFEIINSNKQKIILLGILCLIIILLFLLFFNSPQLITKTIEFNDHTITKTIQFSTNNRTETYAIQTNNPILFYLIIPKTIAKNTTEFEVIGNYSQTIIQEDPIIKLIPTDLTPGQKEITLTTNKNDSNQTTIILPVKYLDYSNFTEQEKLELDETIKQFSNLDQNYFTINETKKIMEEFAQQTITLSNNQNSFPQNNKIFFSENEIESEIAETQNNFFENIITTIKNVLIPNIQSTNPNENNNSNNNHQETNNQSNQILINSQNYFTGLTTSLKNILQSRNPVQTNQVIYNTNYQMTINFKPETNYYNKIIIPYSKENPIIVWNGEITILSDTTSKLELINPNPAIQFDYHLKPNQNTSQKKYVISMTIDTKQLNQSLTKIEAILQVKGFLGAQIPLNIILIENPCENRVTQQTIFENNYHADYVEQLELFNAAECLTNKALIEIQTIQKPDQNWIGRTEQISNQIIKDFESNQEQQEILIKEREKRIKEYFNDFEQAQQRLLQEIKPVIENAEKNITQTKEYLDLIDDKNSIQKIEILITYTQIQVLEKKLLLDPTNQQNIDKKSELELNFYLSSNNLNPTDQDNIEQIKELKNMILANNYAKHGNYHPDPMFIELSIQKYQLEQELYGAMKNLAKKHISSLSKFIWNVNEEKLLDPIFNPHHTQFNTPKNQSFREVILYLGLSKKFVTKQEALQKLSNHNKTHFSSTDHFDFIYPDKFEIEQNRISEIFEEYIGLKLVMDSIYDIKTLNDEIKENRKQRNEIDKTNIDYYPEWLKFNPIQNNLTLQELFLANTTQIGKIIYSEYDPKMNYTIAEVARNAIQSSFFGTLKPKIQTIEHYKFREFIEDYTQAQNLTAQINIFDNIATQEYQKILMLKEKEEKATNWNYFISNLFSINSLNETQTELNLRIEALKGIHQIQNLLLDGYELPQIDQRNINWQQKDDFENNTIRQKMNEAYEHAKKYGTQSAFTFHSELYDQPIKIEGIIPQNKTTHIKTAMLLVPVFNEFKKNYKIESAKILKKQEIEKAETIEKINDILLPKEYQAQLLLENANYYYSESLYTSAHLAYSDIITYFPDTFQAKQAETQLKKFDTWRMLFSKMYWETYSTTLTEVTTLKNIATFIAINATIKYIITPSILSTQATTALQKEYAFAFQQHISQTTTTQLTTVTSNAKLLTNSTRLTNTITKTNQIGKSITNLFKRISSTKLYQVLTYDLTGSRTTYKQWLQKVVQNAALEENAIITSNLKSLSKLTKIPIDQLTTAQITELKNISDQLTLHKVITNSQNMQLQQLLNYYIENNSGILTDVFTSTSETTSIIIQQPQNLLLQKTTQIIPTNLAKTLNNINLIDPVSTTPVLLKTSSSTALQEWSEWEKTFTTEELDYYQKVRLVEAEKRVELLTESLKEATTTQRYVSDSYIRNLKNSLEGAKEVLTNIKTELGLSEVKIACSLCSFKIKTETINNFGEKIVVEKPLSSTQPLIVNPSQPLIIPEITIHNLPLETTPLFHTKQILNPNLTSAIATLTKTAPEKIMLTLETPTLIKIQAPNNIQTTQEIIQPNQNQIITPILPSIENNNPTTLYTNQLQHDPNLDKEKLVDGTKVNMSRVESITINKLNQTTQKPLPTDITTKTTAQVNCIQEKCVFENNSQEIIVGEPSEISISGDFHKISRVSVQEFSLDTIESNIETKFLLPSIQNELSKGKTALVIKEELGQTEIVVFTPRASSLVGPTQQQIIQEQVINDDLLITISKIDDSPVSTEGLPKINLSEEERLTTCCSTVIFDDLKNYHATNAQVFSNYSKFDSAQNWLLQGTDNDARRMRTIIEVWDKGIDFVLNNRVENSRFITSPHPNAVNTFLDKVVNEKINQQDIESSVLRDLETRAIGFSAIKRYEQSLNNFFEFMRETAQPTIITPTIKSGFNALALNRFGEITPNVQQAIDYGYNIIHKNSSYKAFVSPTVINYLNYPRNSILEEYAYHLGFYDVESEALFVTNTITARDSINFRVEFNWGEEMVKYYDKLGTKLTSLINSYNRNPSTQAINEIKELLNILKNNGLLDTTYSKVGHAFSINDPNWPNLLSQVDTISSSVQVSPTENFKKYAESNLRLGEYICGDHHSHPGHKSEYLGPSLGDACHYAYYTKPLLEKQSDNIFENLLSMFKPKTIVKKAPFSYNTISGDDGHIPMIVGEHTCITISENYFKQGKTINAHAWYPGNSIDAPNIVAEIYAR